MPMSFSSVEGSRTSVRPATEVLQATWLTFGLSTLVGERKEFTNFTRALLIGGYGETLPLESTVIELI